MSDTEFKNVILSYYEDLIDFANYLTKNNTEDSKDLVQETYLRALLNKDKYFEDRGIKTWLTVILKNIYIDSKRKLKNITFTYDLSKIDVPEKQNVMSIITLKETYAFLITKKEKFRNPLELSLNGYKYEEICRIEGVNINTVKTRIRRVREEIKALYN